MIGTLLRLPDETHFHDLKAMKQRAEGGFVEDVYVTVVWIYLATARARELTDSGILPVGNSNYDIFLRHSNDLGYSLFHGADVLKHLRTQYAVEVIGGKLEVGYVPLYRNDPLGRKRRAFQIQGRD